MAMDLERQQTGDAGLHTSGPEVASEAPAKPAAAKRARPKARQSGARQAAAEYTTRGTVVKKIVKVGDTNLARLVQTQWPRIQH